VKFFTYQQNNSGGTFVVDANVAHTVFVQAPNAEKANALAATVGVYFDGCDVGIGCECCGDRWSRADDEDGHDVPTIHGEDVRTAGAPSAFGGMWRDQVRIHFADGRICAASKAEEVVL
jgi:hypothetical protein